MKKKLKAPFMKISCGSPGKCPAPQHMSNETRERMKKRSSEYPEAHSHRANKKTQINSKDASKRVRYSLQVGGGEKGEGEKGTIRVSWRVSISSRRANSQSM